MTKPRDITGQKLAPEALQKSYEEFKDLFDNAPVGFHELDAGGRFVRINNTELKMLGYSAEELLGQHVWKIAADEELTRRSVLEKLSGKIPPSTGFERTFRRKDGSTFPVWISDWLLKREDGLIIGSRAAIQDITERKQAEKALLESRALYHSLVEQIPAGIFRKDPEGRYVLVNAWFCRLRGMKEEEILGKTPEDLLAAELEKFGDTRPKITHLLSLGTKHHQHIMSSGERIEVEEEYPAEDGHKRCLYVVKSPVIGSDGKIIGTQGVLFDITERKQVEMALRDHEAFLDTVIENIPHMIFVKDAKELRFVKFNKAGQELLGYSLEELAGKNDYDLFHKELADYFTGKDRQVLLGAKVENIPEETVLTRQNGERILHTKKIPVFDNAGQPLFLLGISEDITGQKRVEEELRSKTAFLEAQMDSALDGVLVVDSQGKKILQNQRLNELWKIPRHILENDDDSQQIQFVMNQTTNPKQFAEKVAYLYAHPDEISRDEIELIDGTIMDRYSAPVKDKAGKYYGRIWAFRDITGHRKLEMQLRHSQKMEAIGQLAGGVAHDFNNILAAITLQGELAMEARHSPEDVRESLQQILVSAERAARLVSHLLLFSRKQVMQTRPVDLNETVTNVAKMLQRLIGEDVRLQLRLHSTPLITRADAGMLDQVLLNLAVNARDAMPRGGTLLIQTAERDVDENFGKLEPDVKPGRYVYMSIKDTGVGIPPEVFPRIFEPFFTTKEPGKGTGLGLATVFGIVKQHQGFLKVESEPGQGADFQVYLPASTAPLESPRVAPKARPLGGVETILLVEDEDSVRSVLRAVLKSCGYQVLEAVNGVEALKLWEQHAASVALLLTDLVMPSGVTGQELAARLQKDRPQIKIIFMSGYSSEVAGRDIKLKAHENYLQKPFTRDQFLETIRHCLDS